MFIFSDDKLDTHPIWAGLSEIQTKMIYQAKSLAKENEMKNLLGVKATQH